MKIVNIRILSLAITLALTTLVISCAPSTQKENPKPVTYEENWESLAQHNSKPEWFADSKLGIYFHWGPYSVPAYSSEWYPRWMYIPKHSDWAKGVYQHHKSTYGENFDYHDFIPMFTGEHFDAKEWADLFQSAGAKFAGPVAQHHDGYAMWASKVNPWNALETGPKTDILGELFTQLKQRNMKTIATFHHARNLQRNADSPNNWEGSDSHFAYHPDLITSTTDPKLRKLYGNIPELEFHDYWLDQVKEVVNDYEPDIIWFDSWLDEIPQNYQQKMVAHHFNAAAEQNKEVVVAYKQKDLPSHIGVLDIEQGGMKEMPEDYWLTDITLSYKSWSYITGQTYKPADLVIRNMIDVWSKKGVVLLNISPKANGVIVEEQRQVLAQMGEWLRAHEEAVYNTRAYEIFGYGDATIEEGHFGGQSATIDYSASDIRFTRSKDYKSIYVFLLGQPEENSQIQIKHLFKQHQKSELTNVSLLNHQAKLNWQLNGNELIIDTPNQEAMSEIATIFKVTFK
ncbi:alpha-L-fucosidase [Paraglaciecola sp.]|uniref:alpha-L-fucosidase n=1 Tax=Paraglaciecola sp. TaxID=1920173 RepID=UPI003EF698ED